MLDDSVPVLRETNRTALYERLTDNTPKDMILHVSDTPFNDTEEIKEDEILNVLESRQTLIGAKAELTLG
jgi:hypothetical protein